MPLGKLHTQIACRIAMAIHGTCHTQMWCGFLHTNMLRALQIQRFARPCTAFPAFFAIFSTLAYNRANAAIIRPHWQTYAIDAFPVRDT